MLLAAVWLAILFATRLTEPIGGLMAAAEQVRGGDLTARVEEGPPNDELGQLARSFNRMASQIEQQRGELVDANKELDTRRRLTDAVLAGVSAGVLSVDGSRHRHAQPTARRSSCWRCPRTACSTGR